MTKPSHHLSRSSIKEGIDNLPSGVCFADRNGLIILCNRLMYRLCQDLLGTDLQHLTELYRALDAPAPPVIAVDAAARVFSFPDGTYWQFSIRDISERGRTYTQVQAIDVTELQRTGTELVLQNQALTAANARSEKLYAELDRIVRERETLSIKMRVHDDLGLCLLSTHRLLTESVTLEQLRRGGESWERVLRRMELTDHAAFEDVPCTTDNLAELTDAAAEIGVNIILRGLLPPEAAPAYLFIVAMRECVTNTARHAGGGTMTVELTHTDAEYRAVITNSGRPPEHVISEGGGLSGLRRSVENSDGVMTVESCPFFRLTVTLPREDKVI